MKHSSKTRELDSMNLLFFYKLQREFAALALDRDDRVLNKILKCTLCT